MLIRLVIAAVLLLVPATLLAARPTEPKLDRGPKLGEQLTQKLRVGIVVKAEGGHCEGIVATTPIPIEWPEQKVKVLEDDLSASVRDLEYRLIDGTVKQMVLTIPYLAAGEECHAITTLEITRSSLLPPESTEDFEVPKKLDKQLRVYLGTSPGIETRMPKIRSLAKEITKGKIDAWEKAQAIYDWVRENVEYKEGDFKGAVQALRDKHGDCEELSSLFIALCRSSGIPARTVWVPQHCYPEFYLVDKQGTGYWFPCQAAGSRDFGGIAEHRPILQKGDNFTDPDRAGRKMRYVSEHVTGRGGKPTVQFIREAVSG